jgi:hypothetical protein
MGSALSVSANAGHVWHTDAPTRLTAAVPPLAALAGLYLGLGVLKRSRVPAVVPVAPSAVPPLAPAHEAIVPVAQPAHVATVPVVPAHGKPVPSGATHAKWNEGLRLYEASVREGSPLSQRGLAAALGGMSNRRISSQIIAHASGHIRSA